MREENKTIKEAVALTYKQNVENAPTVIAKGKGVIAENLIKKHMNIKFPYKKILV